MSSRRSSKRLRKFICFSVCTLATGGIALYAAPFIAATLGAAGLLGAASTGTTIATLHGCALTSASLYAVGGGSMATGTVVITGGGATLGTGICTVANSVKG